MRDKPFYNFTIVGAGASGLWLAHSLLEHGLLTDQTLCMVERDNQKMNDRTWCYWATAPMPPIEMISKSWRYINQAYSSPHSTSLSPYTYYHVRSADFYSCIKDRLKECMTVFWCTEEVTEVSELSVQVQVKSTSQKWLSDYVFLSALPATASGAIDFKLSQMRFLKNVPYNKTEIFLWQSFFGWRVETSEKVFEETSMSMMDFDIDQGNSTQFMYELPFSSTEALVEMTRFGLERLSQQEAEEALKEYMHRKGCAYKITEVEIGAIPMTPAFDMHRTSLSKEDRVIYIGMIGGAIKPTTGFGFKRMREYAQALTISIKERKPLPSMHRPFRFRLYDILLLRILKNHPGKGKEIFEKLFHTQPIQRILRFLDEETSFAEELMIFSRLPIRLFLNSLFSHFFTR